MCGEEVELAKRVVAIVEESSRRQNAVPAVITEYNTYRKKLLEDTLPVFRMYLESIPEETASEKLLAWGSLWLKVILLIIDLSLPFVKQFAFMLLILLMSITLGLFCIAIGQIIYGVFPDF